MDEQIENVTYSRFLLRTSRNESVAQVLTAALSASPAKSRSTT